MIPDNARILRLTAAAGTKFADAYSWGTVIGWAFPPNLIPPPEKGVYDPRAFIPHAVSLDRAFAHCPRFLTAASRRSLGRISVPMWLVVLSDQLPITALVGRYPTNKLIGRSPLLLRRQNRL